MGKVLSGRVVGGLGRVLAWPLGLALSWLVVAGGIGIMAHAAEANSQPRIESAWDKVEAAQGAAAQAAPEVPAEAGETPSIPEYLTLEFGWDVTHNGVKFSGDPTVTFVVDSEPALSLTPTGVAFPRVFEATDDKFKSYLALGGCLKNHPPTSSVRSCSGEAERR